MSKIATTPVAEMDREARIAELMWSEGGWGFGIGGAGAAMAWALMEPGNDNPDWRANVTVHGNPDLYTDDELGQLVEFSRRRTAHYDRFFSYRMGCNLIIIGKCDWNPGKWLRKRMTWEYGPMFSDTLEEAMAVFDSESN